MLACLYHGVGSSPRADSNEQSVTDQAIVNLDGLRILVVDDEADSRELVGSLLEGYGAEVYLADAPRSARAEIGKHVPDVMISDIAMGEEDGYSLVRSIRCDPRREARAIPAIALTAFTRSIDREQAFGAGFDIHLGKPIDVSVLLNAVVELVRRRSRAH